MNKCLFVQCGSDRPYGAALASSVEVAHTAWAIQRTKHSYLLWNNGNFKCCAWLEESQYVQIQLKTFQRVGCTRSQEILNVPSNVSMAAGSLRLSLLRDNSLYCQLFVTFMNLKVRIFIPTKFSECKDSSCSRGRRHDSNWVIKCRFGCHHVH